MQKIRKMMKNISKILLLLVAAMAMSSCSLYNDVSNRITGKDRKEVPDLVGQYVKYDVAENYQLKNGGSRPVSPLIINELEFKSLFEKSKTAIGDPTPIDFSKQIVLAIVLPPTKVNTIIEPISVKVSDNELRYKYKIEKREKMAWAMQPLLILVLDRKYLRDRFSYYPTVIKRDLEKEAKKEAKARAKEAKKAAKAAKKGK